MAEKIFKGFELITEAKFNQLTSPDKQKIYFVRTSTGNTKDDGFIYFNGKKYGTGKLSSEAVQGKLTELQNKVNGHIDNQATVTATERTSGTTETENGNITANDSNKWLSGAAIAEIKKYVDSEDVKNMFLTTDHKIQLRNKSNAVLAELDATSFIKDGMLESVTLVNDTTKGNVLRFTWNTDSKKTVTDIEVSEFFHEISGDTNTITVTQPASGKGSLQISANTVASVSGVTSGATALMTGGITQQYVAQEINTLKTELDSTLALSAKTGSVTYATANIVQTDGKLSTTGSKLVLNVATGLSKTHAGFVYDSGENTFTVTETDFNNQGLLDAQEVLLVLRHNNANVANALTYLNGQITALSGKTTTVTGSTYITVTKAEGTNNYTVSAAKGLTDAITHANSAVQSVNGKSGTTVTLTGADIKIGTTIEIPEGYDSNIEPTDTVNDTFIKILSGLGMVAANTLHGVNGSGSITVSAMSSNQEQTISVNAKPLSETEKAAGQIEIITTGTTGIYGLLYFGGDDVEE